MQILAKLKNLKAKIERVQKLNEDLIESHLANKNKIKSEENKIKALRNGIKESAEDIEQFMKDLDAET